MTHQKIQIQDTFTEIATKTIDDRNRILIGDAIKSLIDVVQRFKIFKNTNGDILLRPVVEIPARELWLFKNKKALKSVKKGIKQSSQGKTKKLDMSRLDYKKE